MNEKILIASQFFLMAALVYCWVVLRLARKKLQKFEEEESAKRSRENKENEEKGFLHLVAADRRLHGTKSWYNEFDEGVKRHVTYCRGNYIHDVIQTLESENQKRYAWMEYCKS